MPTVRLSDKYAERLIPTTEGYEEYFDVRLPGFGVRVGMRGKVWFVSGRTASKKSFKRTLGRVGVVGYHEAFDRAADLLRQAEAGQLPRAGVEAVDVSALTLQKVLDQYLSTKRLKPRTLECYRSLLLRYVSDWLPLHPQQITPDMVLERHAQISAVAPSQADHVAAIIRALYNFADEVYEDLPPMRNPTKRLKTLDVWCKPPPRQTYLRPSMLPKFFAGIETHPGLVADYLLALLLTGARKTEMARLLVSDVHLDDATIIMRDTKGAAYLPVPICDYLLPAFRRRVDDAVSRGTKFVWWSGRTRTSKSGYLTDIRHCITGWWPDNMKFMLHDLRRTYLTYADEAGVSDRAMKALVGHAQKPADVTQGYIQIAPQRLKRETEKVAAVILGYAGVQQ